jgi:hypothetical protein
MIDGLLLLARLFGGLGLLQTLGWTALACFCPPSAFFSRTERHALSLGLGALVLTLWMLILGLLQIPFQLWTVVAPPSAAALLALLRQKYRSNRQPQSGFINAENQAAKTDHPLFWLFFALLAVLFLYATLRAVLYPIWAWDALATWGFKAKAFYLERGLDFRRLSAHNYYPNLVPLLLTYLYLCLGQVNDHLVKLVFPLFGAALLTLVYRFLVRMELNRTRSLAVTAFFALNGVTFVVHLYIAYADLTLSYFTLGAAGLVYLWLTGRAPGGVMPLAATCFAGMTWCKFEGLPLAVTIVLAALLTLVWLRPPDLLSRILPLAWPFAGILLGYLPWRLFMDLHHIETGSDHILGFYSPKFFQAIPLVLMTLFHPKFFGLLWPAGLINAVWGGRAIFSSSRLFLVLFIGGNLLAILLGYAMAPTSAEEFPLYVKGTVDRLLLHLTPVVALLIGEALKDLPEGEKGKQDAFPRGKGLVPGPSRRGKSDQ